MAGWAILIFAGSLQAQQSTPEVPPTLAAQDAPMPPSRDKLLFEDIDLLRRDDFEKASQATVSLRVVDAHGNPIGGLGQSNFLLTVNRTVRKARLLKGSAIASTLDKPLVLLVFLPNQPTIHYIAARDSVAYFEGLPAETLPWSVGIFDANGSFTPFTNQRSVLLANLEAVRTAKEPAQSSSDRFLRIGAGLGWRLAYEGEQCDR
jgi:hypothetical protein